jgi:hypothetical protein
MGDAPVTADPSPRWRRPLTTRCIADETGDIYMKRWYLIETPWFGVKLHHIRRPDQDRALHDHPWAFAAVILRGGYIEHVPSGPPFIDGRTWRLGSSLRARRWRPGTIHRIPADGLHRIDSLPGGSSWSLVFTGRRKRLWGFAEAPGHWVPWTEFETDWDGDAEETRP